MEHNTNNKIYVYDRLNRRLYECGITEIIGYGWCEQKELAAIDAALDYLKTHQTT